MNTNFGDEFTHVQAQIGRADTKASILTGLSLAALTGGMALASKAHLHGLAVTSAVLAGVLIAGALALLGWAIRPNLHGNHGFTRWANHRDTNTLLHELTAIMSITDEVNQLRLLARSAHAKYLRIRLAVDLLGAALALSALTAAFTALGW